LSFVIAGEQAGQRRMGIGRFPGNDKCQISNGKWKMGNDYASEFLLCLFVKDI
jgi:hypothetical protein